MSIVGKLHDYEIYSIEYDRDKYELKLGLKSEAGDRSSLQFRNCQLWDLDPFTTQNVIFEFKAHDPQGYIPPESVIKGLNEAGEFGDNFEFTTNNFEVPEKELEWAIKNQMMIYTIDPSVGMGGYIIAEDVEWLKTI